MLTDDYGDMMMMSMVVNTKSKRTRSVVKYDDLK